METTLSRYRAIVRLLLIAALLLSSARAQSVEPSNRLRDSTANGPTGRWTYRSFRSLPDINTDPEDLLFGQGTLELSLSEGGVLSGTLGCEGWQLVLNGTLEEGAPVTIRFQGKGTIGGEEWVYDYLGYVVPKWPNGVDQRPAIVGSIVRTAAHFNGAATAGYVAQWIAVKQDANPSAAAANADSSAEGELRKLENDWATAVATNDPIKIGRFFPDRFLFVGAGGVLQNRNEHLEDFRSGRLRIESVRVVDFVADVHQEFAVVNVRVDVAGRFAERDIRGTYRFMDTWTKNGTGWSAVARQQTRVAGAGTASPHSVDATNKPEQSAQKRPDVVPMRLLEAPRNELPSERLLRQKYLEEDPLLPPRTDSSSRPDASSTKPTKTAPRPAQIPNAAGSSIPLPECPVEVRSSGGRLDVTLDVAYHTATIGKDQVRLRMYNKCLIGPTLRVKAGDVMYITLNNRLPVESSTPHDVNGHHAWNTTNLHFHGLHVAPQGPVGVPDQESDNVLLAIPPSGPFDPAVSTQKYRVQIPPNHVAGTFWYHAHKHGSTTAQVSSGMAGALIVERDDAVHNLDSVAEVAAAKEEIMVLQEIPYLKDPLAPFGEIERSPPTAPDPNLNDVLMFGPASFRNLRRYVTVNGEKIPTIIMAPSEIRRLRLVYSGQRDSIQLRVERDPSSTAGPEFLTLHEIAVDGLPTGSIRATDREQPEPRDRVLELFPGYRSDVLLQAPNEASEYYLVDTKNDGATPRPDTGADGSPELLRWVAKIRVEGTPVSMALPAESALAPHRLPDLSPAAATDTQFAFYGLELTLSPIGFFISRADLSTNLSPVSTANSEAYNPSNPRLLPQSATERWLVGSRNAGAAVVHPFHIHTNPFLITKVTSLIEPGSPGVPTDVTNREIGEPTWRDTLAMKHGYTYALLTRYDNFTGDFVDHCHILDHEDNGMMELVRIATAPPAPQAAATATSASQNQVVHSIPDASGKPSVLFFVQGSACPHCMSQLTEMASKLTDKVPVAVVSASTEADLQNFPDVPFALVPDPDLKLFKKFGAYDGAPKHATIVRDGAGKELLRKVGNEPFLDAATISKALDHTAKALVIAVHDTDSVDDDYVTWSPTACTIRMVNGDTGSGPVSVTLTNEESSANPDAGELRFASSLLPQTTATLNSITLQVNPDGTPVDFFIAGVKASTLTAASLSTGGRDTKIVIHESSESGARLGEHAVMVRVRKAVRHPSDPRPKLTEFELSEILKAIRDLHLIDNRLEWYVRMHRLATGHGTFAHFSFGDPPNPRWPDLAHQGPAFIAWHRAFLLQFERELQVRYPHVALPYWVQGTSQTFFTEDRLGEPASSGDVVQFQPGSPLYGWSISLPADRGGSTAPMGWLRRRPLDHNDPAAPSLAGRPLYRQWSNLATLSNIDQFVTIRRAIEGNPHNEGHGVVGPNGIWMSNCRESNADPAFYFFHCNHDYLWAKWQYEMDRFLNDGSDPAHYSPADAFTDATADRTIPFGHHLKDTMWPWDGTMGDGALGATSNRPNVNDFGAFPTSRAPSLWPPAPAQPSPANMIDYLGMLSRSNDLGYCYDDVPFGVRQVSPIPIAAAAEREPESMDPLAIAVIGDRSAGSATRMLALKSMDARGGNMAAESARAVARIAVDAAEPPDLRSAALHRWFTENPAEAFDASLGMMADKQSPLDVRLTAVEEVGRQTHFSELPHSQGHIAFDQFRAILREESPAPLKAAAVRHLAPAAEPLAKTQLLKALESPNESAMRPAEAVALLRFFPEEKARIREFISSANEDAAVAAIQALFKDPETIDQRRRLVRDTQRASEVRNAAIQSLIHEEPGDLTNFLIEVSADEAMDLDLRQEALAAASVRLRKGVKTMSDADKQKWTGRLNTVRAADTTELGQIRSDALSVLRLDAR